MKKIFLHTLKNGGLTVNSMQKAGTHMLVNALAKSVSLKYSERGIHNDTFRHG